jgi:hypothetical protein
MSLPANAADALATRESHTRIMSNGVSIVSPLWYLATMGLPKSRTEIQPDVQSWRKDIKWAQGGKTISVDVRKGVGTGTVNADPFRYRDFAETFQHARATYDRYNVEHTWVISEGDIDANKGDSQMFDLRGERRRECLDTVYNTLRTIPWNANETNQNGGLTMFSPTNATTPETYGGIAMDATDDHGNYYWCPTGYDYGNLAIDTNFLSIYNGLWEQMKASSKGNSAGRVESPDFAAFSSASWAEFVAYVESKLSINVMSENAPRNFGMYDQGFHNVKLFNTVMFPDDDFGGPTGYVEAKAAEEFMMGFSKYLKLNTTAPKGKFIRPTDGVKNDSMVAGELGAYKTGLFTFFVENPRYFQIAYT